MSYVQWVFGSLANCYSKQRTNFGQPQNGPKSYSPGFILSLLLRISPKNWKFQTFKQNCGKSSHRNFSTTTLNVRIEFWVRLANLAYTGKPGMKSFRLEKKSSLFAYKSLVTFGAKISLRHQILSKWALIQINETYFSALESCIA